MEQFWNQFGDYSVSLEDIFRTGSDEIELDSMLPSWIEALAKRPERATDQLLVDAQNMLQDKETALENASRYAEIHPALYHSILYTGIGDAVPEKMMSIGLRAMKEVPVKYPARSGISLLTAKYALVAKNRRTGPAFHRENKKRVAAYCRTSTDLDNQEDSYEMQVAYYTSNIAAHEEWEFAGIYADEKSGTKAENRPGFQKLIRDALDGRVDYILVKSISHFSRNIVDAQGYVKLLHGNGIDVHFDKENLDTADPSCSMWR